MNKNNPITDDLLRDMQRFFYAVAVASFGGGFALGLFVMALYLN